METMPMSKWFVFAGRFHGFKTVKESLIEPVSSWNDGKSLDFSRDGSDKKSSGMDGAGYERRGLEVNDVT